MMEDGTTLPIEIGAGGGPLSTVAQLAEIPEEDIWLAKQIRGACTRRACRQDVQQFIRTLAIASPAELRQTRQ